MTNEVTTVQWVFDSEGVHVCSDCWDDEMRTKWPRGEYEAGDDIYCESCHRYLDDEAPAWMKDQAKDEVVALARIRATDAEISGALAKLDRLSRPWTPEAAR